MSKDLKEEKVLTGVPLRLQTCLGFCLPCLNLVALPPEVFMPETRETHHQHPTCHHILLIPPSKYMSNLSPSLHSHRPGPRHGQLLARHCSVFSSRCLSCRTIQPGGHTSFPSRHGVSRKLALSLAPGVEHVTQAHQWLLPFLWPQWLVQGRAQD